MARLTRFGDLLLTLSAHRISVRYRQSRLGDHPAYAQQLVKLTKLTFHAPDGSGVPSFRTAEPLLVRLRFTATEPVEHVRFEVAFHSVDGRVLYATLESPGTEAALPPGGVVEFVVPSLPLQGGAYHVGAVARDARTSQAIDWRAGGSTLDVEAPGRSAPGQMHIPHTSTIVSAATRPLDSSGLRR